MPQDLAALLVEEGAVSRADMDRAVARQAQQGGALDTALLELGLIGEGHLLSFLAHASGLPPAPPDAYKDIDARARRVFPGKVAERHRLAPLALDGRELMVVACHPVDSAAIDEIGFMLSLTLVPHVGVEWRVHDLIHRLYGGQLSTRLAALADASRQPPAPEAKPEPKPEPGPKPGAEPVAPPAKAEAPPPAAPVEPAPPAKPAPAPALSIEEAFFAAGEAGTFTPAPSPAEPAVVPAPAPAPEPREPPVSAAPEQDAGDDAASFADIEPERPQPSGFGGESAEPAEPLLAALEHAVDAYDALWADKKAEPAPQPVPAVPPAAEGEAPAALQAPGGPEPLPGEPPSEPAAAEPPGSPGEQPAEELEEEPEEPPQELDRSAPPRWSIDDARTALAAARHRDEVVVVALRYARDFFEYSALFAVTRDAVVGHDALGGPEDERARCRATAIYANDPGIVRTVLETGAPYLGPVVRDTVGTSNILDGLWRGSPRTVLVYPILIGDRPVAALYADNGDAPVSPRRLGDLLLFLSTVGGTFERIIRARKKRGKRRAAPPPPPPPPDPPEEVAAPGPMPDWMEPPPSAQPAPGPDSPAEPAPRPPPSADAAPPEPPAPPPAPAPVEPPSPASDAKAEEKPGPPAEVPQSPVERAMAVLLGKTAPTGDRASGIVDLVLDPDPDVAAAAREALVSHRAEPEVKPLPERLRRALLSGTGDRPVLAARALGALRDVDSIPILIQALEGGAAQAAADALRAITLQHLGTSPQKWLRWWKENRAHSRAEWLFAALTSGDLDDRVAASGELRAAGEPPVRYSPDMPAAELDAAARAWWIWWSRQGIKL